MFKISLISVVVLSLARAGTASAAAAIAVDQPAYDFGSISQGAKMEHVFTIRNKGDEPLTINSINPSCGCTSVTTSSKVIAPGDYVEIKATFDSAGFCGDMEKTVSVETNDPRNPSATLNLKGTVIEDFQIVPEHIDLGHVTADVMQTARFTVTNTGNKPLKLTAIVATPPQIVAVAEKKLLQPKESGIINVSVTPREEDRMVSGVISIMTDNPAKPEVKVSIYGSL